MDELTFLVCQAAAQQAQETARHRAFAGIVRRFQDMAFGCAFAALGDFHLAEDAAQEAFLTAWRHLDQLRTPEAFPGWFRRIVLTQCNRQTRTRRAEVLPWEDMARLPALSDSDPFALVLRKETALKVQLALASLPEHERMVTTLYYIANYPQNEIAAFLEMPVTTVKKRLFSARKRLRERMVTMVQETLQSHRPSRNEGFAETVTLFNASLDAFVCRVKQDANIIAVILFGSLSHDEVWHKSDIDIILISRHDRPSRPDLCLVENGVNIHAVVIPRNKFRAALEGSLQSSFFHSSFSKSTLLYTTDDTIREYYMDVQRVGEHDKAMYILGQTGNLLYTLTKAEKWFHVKKDYDYATLWLLNSVLTLAKIETMLAGEVTGRESLYQALRINPSLFKALYTDLLNLPKTAESVEAALARYNAYLTEKTPVLFRPLLTYLADADRVRPMSEIDEYFRKQAQTCSLGFVCEWLADQGVLQKVPSPARLTDKSRVAVVDEAAYYFDRKQMTGNREQ